MTTLETPQVVTMDGHDEMMLGLGVGLTMLLTVGGIFALCWYCRRKKTKGANRSILIFVVNKYCERVHKIKANQGMFNDVEESRNPVSWAGIENNRTTFLAAAYVELSDIFPAKEFKMYFRQLEIDECTIQRIETEHHGNVREQCYRLFMVWERMRKNKTKLSHVEWSLELIHKLKHRIDERLKTCLMI